ncbi:MAG: large subunit ribosomal protein [Gaiellaceae bacterium]|jgi:large subunit ribosomal protein L10|nr:large subunit ribosomal protein [Gaiellaceae bacterium]
MHRDKKTQVVAELTEEIRGATALLVTDPRGLNVGQLSELRRSLRTHGASFRVTKNTLGRIAAKDAGADALVDLLSGPSGVALCTTDPAPVAKALADFARTSRLLELRGGVLDGRAINAEDARRLATLPPRIELLTQLVGGLASPIQGFANVLAQLPRSLVVALDQVRQQKEAAAA